MAARNRNTTHAPPHYRQIEFDFPRIFLLESWFAYFQPCPKPFEAYRRKYGLGSRLSLIHT